MKKLVGINRTLLSDTEKEILMRANDGKSFFIDVNGITEKEIKAIALCISNITTDEEVVNDILLNSKILLYEQQKNIYFIFLDIDTTTIHKKWLFLIDNEFTRFDLSENRDEKNGFFDFIGRIH